MSKKLMGISLWGWRSLPPPPSTVCWKGFYVDITKESRCNNEIKIWANFYNILVVFWYPCQCQANTYVTHRQFYLVSVEPLKSSWVWGIIYQLLVAISRHCFDSGSSGSSKFDRNQFRLLFQCCILTPRKCPRKISFNTQFGIGLL